MDNNNDKRLHEILKEYADLPAYSGMNIPSVHTKDLFGNYPINTAAIRGFPEEVVILLSHGADVNAIGEYGYTPLHDAVEQGYIEIVKLLLKAGANISAKTADGDTPITLAAILNEEEILHLLQNRKVS